MQRVKSGRLYRFHLAYPAHVQLIAPYDMRRSNPPLPASVAWLENSRGERILLRVVTENGEAVHNAGLLPPDGYTFKIGRGGKQFFIQVTQAREAAAP
ncbi:hypothetical protein L1281_000824 [Neisseria sp. HSC-16F19]|nr:hypothetical protein [Neisseria sp. HSC-16F19]MCP2040242.1 hypothetical protein [Neisseria sp. HSC-16F19]